MLRPSPAAARRLPASPGTCRARGTLHTAPRAASFLAAPSRPRRRAPLAARALDAAQPFDFEARAAAAARAADAMNVGIVGFGTFGQFLAARLVAAGHKVSATSRTPYHARAAELGVTYYDDADDFCESHPDIVILATSILSTAAVLDALPVARLKRSTLVVDVLSVKEFPKRALLARLPASFDILCTHPMFGPDSGAGSWDGLAFVYDKVRVGKSPARARRADALLAFFRGQGCRMVEMACEEHDRLAAGTQFLTHTVGRVLGGMGVSPTAIDTKGYQSLLSLVANTANDSFDLYYGLFMYNPNAVEELERLERAIADVKAGLLRRLHGALRAETFGATPPPSALVPDEGGDTSPSPSASSNGGGGNGVAGEAGGVSRMSG